MSKRPATWRGAAKTGLTGLVRSGPLAALFGAGGEKIAVAYSALCAALGAAVAANKAASPTYADRVIYVRS